MSEVPDFQSMMLPTLVILSDGKERNSRTLSDCLATHYGLNDDQRTVKHEKSHLNVFENNLAWATTYLFKAGLLEKPRRGVFRITEEGMTLLKSKPETINTSYLKQHYSIFADWQSKKHFQEADETEESQTAVQYWMYAPGEGAKYWEEYLREGLLGIG